MDGCKVRRNHSRIARSTLCDWGIELRLTVDLEAGTFPSEHLAGKGLCLFNGVMRTVPVKEIASSLSC